MENTELNDKEKFIEFAVLAVALGLILACYAKILFF